MSLEIREMTEKSKWENFLEICEEKTFLHSWNWGAFQQTSGNKIWRLGVFNDSELLSVILIVKILARRGTFLFIPHGPVLKTQNPKIKSLILNTVLNELKKLAKREKATFIRISPIWGRTAENIEIFNDLKLRTAPIHMHPELTWELDLSPSEEELLHKMRETTRYLIRRAPKAGVEIIKSKNIESVEEFNKLYQKTVDRHHFVPFSLNYLKNEFLSFAPDDQILILLGKHNNSILSAAMIIFWSGIAFYHQGASITSKIPVSYALQWEAIKEAKKRNCKKYNFWGIAPDDNPNHPWRGLTLFKTGFGGKRQDYVKTQDLPFSGLYWLIHVFEKIRKTKRGL